MIEIGIHRREHMPMLAGIAHAVANILFNGDGFEVPGVDTSRAFTQVIEREPFRDRPTKVLIEQAIDFQLSSGSITSRTN